MFDSASRRHFIKLLSYARPYRLAVAGQLSLMIISIGFGILKPWPLKVVLDNVVGDQPLLPDTWIAGLGASTILLLACISYLVFHAGESAVQLGSTTLATLTCSRMIRDLRSNLLERLQALSLRFHDSHKVGDLVHRVAYNASSVETAYQSGFMGVIKSAFTLIGMFVVMLLLSPMLTLVALTIVPLLLLAIRWYASRINTASREHQDKEGAVASRLQETLSGIRLVQAFVREPSEQKRFEEACNASVRTRLKSSLVQQSFGLLTTLVLAAGTALLFWIGAREVLAGRLTVGEFVVFNAYLAMLYAPLSVLSYASSSVQSALGGASRLFEILDAEPDLKDGGGSLNPMNEPCTVEISSVSFGYQLGPPVLDGVSVKVEAGKMLGIVGETGGGKSTLLNLLLRFYDPWQGTITINDRDIRELKLESLRSAIAYVPQDTILLSGSIIENIAYARPSARRDEVMNAARDAEALEFIEEFPDGLDTEVGERGVRLSVGQRQRIAIARAFLKDAPILLLDEPSSALDAETESRLMQTLNRLMKGRTVVLVGHRLSTIQHADHIAVLSHGRILEMGTHDELIACGGNYSRLWSTQMSGYQPSCTEAL